MDLKSDALLILKQSFFDNQLLSVDEIKQRVNATLLLYRQWCEKNADSNDSRFYNKFFGEVIPIYLLSSHLNVSHVMIIGKDEIGFDGIFFEKGDCVFFIECTHAVNGEQRHLQLEHMRQYGRSPALNQIRTNEKSKASGNRVVEFTESEMVSRSELEATLVNSLIDVINRKITKNSPSYKNAWLLVSFYRGDYEGICDSQLSAIGVDVISKVSNNIFKRIYIIGIDSSIGDGNNFICEHVQ